VLFQELQLPSAKRTRTGQVSTGVEVLEELRGVHPAIGLILEHRQLQKLMSTYVDALPGLVNPHTGRVHTSFNQTMAATGRLSSSDPNVQNIPIRTELGRRVRRAFVAGGPGLRLVSADYAQIELRILAHITRDPTLVQAFEEDQDIHAATAAEVMGLPIEQVTVDQRRLAKTVNFGVLYGMSEYGLAWRTDLPQREASAFIERYFERFGTIREYQDQVMRDATKLGYVTTLLGRRRYMPELKSPVYAVRQAALRAAINHPIQGTQADIIKLAMIDIQSFLDGDASGSRMLLQVHDELVFEVPEAEIPAVSSVVRQAMIAAAGLSVPVRVDVKVGSNWEELTPLDASD
jgi:DNA polymerase-1